MRYFILLIGLALLTCAACSDNGTPPEVDTGKKPLVTALIDSEEFAGEWSVEDPPVMPVPRTGIFYESLVDGILLELVFSPAAIQVGGTYPTDSCLLEIGNEVYESSYAEGSIAFSKFGDELVEGSFSVILIDQDRQSESLMTGSFTGDPFLRQETMVVFELNAESYTCEKSGMDFPRGMRYFDVEDDDFDGGEAAHIYIAVYSIDQSWVGDYDVNRSDNWVRMGIGLDSFSATDGLLTVSSTDSIPIFYGGDVGGYDYVIGTGNFHFTASSNDVPPKIITVTDGLVDINGLD
jgi:hypothetical protein